MRLTVLLIFLPIAALLAVCALMIRFKKTYWMISGYNTMSEEDKSNVDKEKMGKATSNSILIIAVLVALGGLFLFLNMDTAGIAAMMLILPVTLVTVAVSQKYDHNFEPAKKKNNIILIVVLGIFFTAIIGLVFLELSTGSKLPSYTIQGETFEISGMSGESINTSDIKSVEMKNNLPNNISKKSGFDFNTILKGRFSSDIGEIKLYVDTAKPPFIYIKTKDEIIILNNKAKAETKKLYDKLEAAYKK